MKLLATHDQNFDGVRTFLISAMIFTHGFEMFYILDYNRRLTYFVTIGFVFLSGFTMGVLYTERIRSDKFRWIMKLSIRSLKLLLIFVACNFFVVLCSPVKKTLIMKQSVADIIISMLLGDNQRLFAFDILVPIALTSFFFIFISVLFRDVRAFVFVAVFLFLIGATEYYDIMNYFGVKFLLIGLAGSVSGYLVGLLDWQRTLRVMIQYGFIWIIGAGLLLFFLSLGIFTQKGGEIDIAYQIIPTAALLLWVYLISFRWSLSYRWSVSLLNRTLSTNILFAYLFHILLINILFLMIPKDSLSLFPTLLVSVLILILTIATCQVLNILSSTSVMFQKLYSTLFKL